MAKAEVASKTVSRELSMLSYSQVRSKGCKDRMVENVYER